MTHPLTNALAMRTAAVAVVYPTLLDTALSTDLTANILAIPLEADHAALVAEAARLPEIAALIRDAKAVISRWETPAWKDAGPTGTVIYALRDTILALETP